MLKKIAFAGLGIALLASPLLASADTLSDLQAKIQALLSQIRDLQSQMAQLQGGGAGGVGVVVPPSQYPVDPITVCPEFRRALVYGATGTDVTQLQQYLKGQGVFSDSPTGFFGAVTQAALQKWQAQSGIVSSGDPATTGWGVVGPATRAWIFKRCGGGGGGGNSGNLSASPTSGPAPLAVNFTANNLNAGSSYTVDFGDGASGQLTLTPLPCAANVSCPLRGIAQHTYTSNGTYTATLNYQPPFVCQGPSGTACAEVMPASKTIGTITITVGDTAICNTAYLLCPAGKHHVNGPGACQQRCEDDGAAGAPSISGLDAPTTLNVGQTGTWTVHASVSNLPGVQLHYSVIWGDESAIGGINAFVAGMAPAALQTSSSFTHAYQSAGTYNPTFTVANDVGSTQTSASVSVGGAIQGCPMYQRIACPAGQHYEQIGSPTYDANGCQFQNMQCVPDVRTSVSFSAWPTSGAAPLTSYLTISGASSASSYSVNFGDGTSGSNWQADTETPGVYDVPHVYASQGTYTATLQQTIYACQTNSYPSTPGCPTTTTVGTATITVTGTSISPVSTLTATPTSGAAPLSVVFTSNASGAISFGDGTSGTLIANPMPMYACPTGAVIGQNVGSSNCVNPTPSFSTSHTYTSVGTYTATLTTAGACPQGYCAQTASATITVNGGGSGVICPAGTSWRQVCTTAPATCPGALISSAGQANKCVGGTTCSWGCYSNPQPLPGAVISATATDANANLASVLTAIEAVMNALHAQLGQ